MLAVVGFCVASKKPVASKIAPPCSQIRKSWLLYYSNIEEVKQMKIHVISPYFKISYILLRFPQLSHFEKTGEKLKDSKALVFWRFLLRKSPFLIWGGGRTLDIYPGKLPERSESELWACRSSNRWRDKIKLLLPFVFLDRKNFRIFTRCPLKMSRVCHVCPAWGLRAAIPRLGKSFDSPNPRALGDKVL